MENLYGGNIIRVQQKKIDWIYFILRTHRDRDSSSKIIQIQHLRIKTI